MDNSKFIKLVSLDVFCLTEENFYNEKGGWEDMWVNK